jgi:hypothetical protein
MEFRPSLVLTMTNFATSFFASAASVGLLYRAALLLNMKWLLVLAATRFDASGEYQKGAEVWHAWRVPLTEPCLPMLLRSTVAVALVAFVLAYGIKGSIRDAISPRARGSKLMTIGSYGSTSSGEVYVVAPRTMWVGIVGGNPLELDYEELELLMGHSQSIQSTRGPIQIGMVGRTAHGTECIAVPFKMWYELFNPTHFDVHPDEVRALKAPYA